MIIAPLLASGNYGPSMRRADGLLDIYGIISGTGQQNGITQFGGEENLRYMAWHEFSHSFVNPEFALLSNDVDRSKKLMSPIEARMGSQSYNRWLTVVDEHVVRAVTVRLSARILGEDAGKAALERERGRGFAYIEAILGKLKEYEQQGDRYPTFHAFAPQIVALLNDLAGRDLPTDYYEAPFTGTLESASNATGPTVLIVPTGESDVAAQQRIVDYVKQMQARFFAGSEMITDQQALERDLSKTVVYAYGTLTGNRWLAKYKDLIPAVAALDQVKDTGPLRLIATLPNPQNPKRGVTAYTATDAAAVYGIQSLFHGPTAWVIGRGNTVLKSGDYRLSDGHWVLK
jgi:hypothetical protein